MPNSSPKKSTLKHSKFPNKAIQSSIAKRHFGKYFHQAVNQQPVLITNGLLNKSAVLVDLELFEDLIEVVDEMNNPQLKAQLQASHKEHENNESEEGLEGLIEIMNATVKKELMN